jgi:hypothetical protein
MYGYNLGLAKARVSESVPAAPANVVLPSLVGNGAVGSVVTCNPGAWSGSPSPTFTFNFKLDTVSVQSGASNTYTPLIGDDTKTLTCTVTATNTEGSANADTSNSLVVGTAPANTVAPVISGTNTFGSTLTTTNGTFTGTAPLNYTYQWLRGGSPITGETLSTYVIGASDSLAAITCEVKATNSYGFDSEVSNTITVQDFAPLNTVAPTVSPSGTQSTGTLITANVGTWTGVAPITYEYKWTRNGVAISGETASTYTIQLADDGTTIRVEVKGTNTYGTSAFIASSNSVSAVNVIAPVNTSAPVISGTTVVSQVLTTTNGTWANSPTSFSYQWKRGATNIGTNASTYTLVQADAGNTSNITCVVTATNAGGSANATSNQIAQILTVRTSSFLTASAISDATIRGGLNTFDVGLISNGLDTKMKALYPFVGGTASTHKFNFMNAADTNAAFRLLFVGTWVHDSTGILSNGSNAYANTYFTPVTQFTSRNSLSIIANISGGTLGGGTSPYTIAGGSGSFANDETGHFFRATTKLSIFVGESNNILVATNSTTTGYSATNSLAGATSYVLGTSVIASGTVSANGSLGTFPLFISAINQGGTPFFVSYQSVKYNNISFGDGLTLTEHNNYRTLINAFNTSIGR